MTDQEREPRPDETGEVEPEQRERRNFLLSLGKWSKAVIGGVALGGILTPDAQAQGLGWANSRDGDKTWVSLRHMCDLLEVSYPAQMRKLCLQPGKIGNERGQGPPVRQPRRVTNRVFETFGSQRRRGRSTRQQDASCSRGQQQLPFEIIEDPWSGLRQVRA